jgi:hypothetical protein
MNILVGNAVMAPIMFEEEKMKDFQQQVRHSFLEKFKLSKALEPEICV